MQLLLLSYFVLLSLPAGPGRRSRRRRVRENLGPKNVSVRTRDPLTDTGFEHFYNLDYDHAIQDFERVLEKHPDDPFAVNHLITGVLMVNSTAWER